MGGPGAGGAGRTWEDVPDGPGVPSCRRDVRQAETAVVELTDVYAPNVERDAAEAIVAKAHTVCPYSNATRGNVEVTLTVV